MPIHLACVVGARPNFVKMAPMLRAFAKRPELQATLIHTGQHYDAALSDVFFEQLEMRRPDIHLEVGSGTHGQQTARVLEKMEQVLEEGPPGGGEFSRLVVVGDVNSTMAATLAAAKLQIPVAHVEAGLRSFDRTMPEEINRLVTDAISDLLLCSEPTGIDNLLREGRPAEAMQLVGNVMIDTLRWQLDRLDPGPPLAEVNVAPGEYGVVTLHRPSNVDDPQVLAGLVNTLVEVSTELPIVFPIHPRTRDRLERADLLPVLAGAEGVRTCGPIGYLEFMAFTSQAKVVVTDSGGLQEETTALGVPCLTMRANTERPITVDEGTSTLIGSDVALLKEKLHEVLVGTYKRGRCPELWDGKASERIAAIFAG